MKLNWNKFSVATVAGALLFTAAAVVFSQGPQGPPRRPGFRGGPGPDGLGPFGRELNLTDDQKTQIKKITENLSRKREGFS